MAEERFLTAALFDVQVVYSKEDKRDLIPRRIGCRGARDVVDVNINSIVSQAIDMTISELGPISLCVVSYSVSSRILIIASTASNRVTMETSIENDNTSPSLFRFILGFVIVGIAWGLTTPFMRKAAVGYQPPARPFLEDEKVPFIKRKSLGIWYGATDLLRRPSYSVPLIINLSGSVWFFLIVGQAGGLT